MESKFNLLNSTSSGIYFKSYLVKNILFYYENQQNFIEN